MIVPREGQQILILCFAKKALERMFHVLVSHANAQAFRGRPTSKDDERFPNGSRSVHEFHSLKALKTLKKLNISDVEKTKNVHEQNFDIDTNHKK